MAENIYLKTRVSKIEMCDPITSAAGLATAVWEDLPVTLRDDEILIADADAEETEVFSHQNDAAEDYDIVGVNSGQTDHPVPIQIDHALPI